MGINKAEIVHADMVAEISEESPQKVEISTTDNSVTISEQADNTINMAVTEQSLEVTEFGFTNLSSFTLDDIANGTNYGKILLTALSNGVALLSAAAGSLDDIANGLYAKVLAGNVNESGRIIMGEIVGDLDDISNGSSYGRVNLTDISAGSIVLTSVIGDLDDIADGTNYDKVLSTTISAGKILLAQADKTGYTLDDVSEGATYGRVAVTDIQAGSILLSSTVGDLDDIADGTGYGKIDINDISSGHILLSTTSGTLDDIANGATYGRVDVTYITAGAINLATNIVSQGNLATQNSVAWATEITSIPGTLGAPAGTGLFLSTTYMGFYTGGQWTSYIKNDGDFAFAGDATHYITWNGSALNVKGMVSADSLSAFSADLGTITAGNITLDSSGYIQTVGKTSYGDTDAGFWMGYDTDKYKMNFGDGTYYFKWTGTAIELGSPLITGLATGFETSLLGWVNGAGFSSTDQDTVSWAGGDIVLSDGTTYTIAAGNTGNMAAVTYIYLDKAVSSGTVLQVTTTAATSVGVGKILVCVAKNNAEASKKATFQAFGTNEQTSFITVDNMAANSVDTNELAANSVTANEINVANLAAINANLGTITAGSLSINSGVFAVDTSGVMTATSGTIGGFTITADTLYAGSGATAVYMKSDAGFWAGATAQGSAPFSVSVAGVLYAVSGSIGGFALSSTAGLFAGSGVTHVHMKPGEGIWCGGTLSGDAPFYANQAGAVTCSNITITGGGISGWSIGATQIASSSNNIILDSDAEKIYVGGTSGNHMEIDIGGSTFQEIRFIDTQGDESIKLYQADNGTLGIGFLNLAQYNSGTLEELCHLDPSGISRVGSTGKVFVIYASAARHADERLNLYATTIRQTGVNNHIIDYVNDSSGNLTITSPDGFASIQATSTTVGYIGLTATGQTVAGTNGKIVCYMEQGMEWRFHNSGSGSILMGNIVYDATYKLSITSAGTYIKMDPINCQGNILIPAGSGLYLDGGSDDYIIYQNSRIEFFVAGVLEGYIDSNGFVST